MYQLRNHKFAKSFILILTALSLAGCSTKSSPPPAEPLRETQFIMGTAITLSLYDHQDEALLNQAFSRLQELEDQLSINKENTLLDEVNTNAGIKPVEVNADMFKIIEKGLYYSNLTSGAFDITIGPLVKLWNIGFPNASVPTQEAIDHALPLIDYSLVELNKDKQSVYLKQPGMKLDLGGIAKGYAADETVKLLKENGVEHALIDLGGNVFTLGTKLDGTPWKVGIQDPFNPRGNTVGYIPVSDKSIVTSGIYERYLEVGDKKYHHILNPETGYPFENEIAGVTIVSDASIDGDALSTSIFSMGIEEGLAFVESFEDIDAIFISKDKKVYISSGLKDTFVLTNQDFTLMNNK